MDSLAMKALQKTRIDGELGILLERAKVSQATMLAGNSPSNPSANIRTIILMIQNLRNDIANLSIEPDLKPGLYWAKYKQETAAEKYDFSYDNVPWTLVRVTAKYVQAIHCANWVLLSEGF